MPETGKPASEFDASKIVQDCEMSTAKIDKVEAAGRQLSVAIQLWLEERDGLAVHTLTMAAFGILNALCRKDPQHVAFMDRFLAEFGHKRFYETTNFLKHADRDPDAVLNEPISLETEYRIGLCLVMYRCLRGDLTPEMGAFHLMSLATYPEFFKVAADPDPDIEEGSLYGAKIARADVSARRMLVRSFLSEMRAGKMSPNINVRRVDRASS